MQTYLQRNYLQKRDLSNKVYISKIMFKIKFKYYY
jgi:hypothetical protein